MGGACCGAGWPQGQREDLPEVLRARHAGAIPPSRRWCLLSLQRQRRSLKGHAMRTRIRDILFSIAFGLALGALIAAGI